MQKRLDVYELLYKQDLHSLKQFSTNFHSFKEYITIKLILNKIIKCFEKEENQMMIIRCRKKKPWWTKCLRKKKFSSWINDTIFAIPRLNEVIYYLKPWIKFSDKVKYSQWLLINNHTMVVNVDVLKRLFYERPKKKRFFFRINLKIFLYNY
jgi:hypothetical protein